jgi:ribonuclease HI
MYLGSYRRGRQGVVGARARQEPAGSHSGTWRDYLCRHGREAEQAAHGDAAQRQQFLARLPERTADPRNVKHAWEYLAAGDGQAPGVDDLRYDDLADYEVWDLARAVGKAIRDGTYRVARDREHRIPKTSGHGTRTLSIPTVIDRVVQRAIVQTVQPYLDPMLDPCSLGYRPGLDRHHALALAERMARDSSRWVWVCEDIQDAFNQVPQRRLLDIVRHHLTTEEMLGLIERVVLTSTGRGLRQGGCLSPLLLNVYLDWLFDRMWRKRHPNLPFIRVADDLLVLCQTDEEARTAHADLKDMLRVAAMPLKGSSLTAIRNLDRGQAAHWLGFELRKKDGELRASMTEKAWNRLEDCITSSQGKPDAALRANEAIIGWVSQMGPCFPQTDIPAAHAKVSSLALNQAFDEIPSQGEIRNRWQRAYARWRRARKRTMEPDRGGAAVGSAYRHRVLAETSQPGGASARGAPPASRPERKVRLYCDGSCLQLTRVGGWAYILEDLRSRQRESRSGSSPKTTNNRMELMAVLRGLESLAEPARVRLVIDSEYVSRGIDEWLPRWKQQGWRTGSGRRRKEVKNRGLWQRLDRQLQRHEVTCEWVRGHAGHPENETCDRLSRQAARQRLVELRAVEKQACGER